MDLIVPQLTQDIEDMLADEDAILPQAKLSINSHADLKYGIEIITYCIGILHKVIMEEREQDKDELMIFGLGSRIFDHTCAALRLALIGHYAAAVTMIRDILETAFLLQYFKIYPGSIARWREVENDNKCKEEFKPFMVRDKLDEFYGSKGKKRAEAYHRLCKLGAHPTFKSFEVMYFERDGQRILKRQGAFLNEATLRKTIEELSIRTTDATVSFVNAFPELSTKTLGPRIQFMTKLNEWFKRCKPREDYSGYFSIMEMDESLNIADDELSGESALPAD